MTTTNPTDALFEVLNDAVNAANAIALEAKSALGNSAKQVKEMREDENTDDPVVRKFQEIAEKILAKLEDETKKVNEHIRAKLGTATWSEEHTEQKKNEYNENRKRALGAYKALETMFGYIGQDAPEMPELLTFKGSASGGTGKGTGTRRLRFDRVEVNGEEVKNLSAVAAKIKAATGESISAKDLQAVVFETAQTEDMDEIAALGDVTFQWTSTDKDNVTHTFDVTVFKAPSEDDEDNDSEE